MTAAPASADRSATAPEIDVQLTDISKSYDGGATWSVKELDISIRRGEFFSILGPSGCGKSTMLRMIGGMESPTTGTVAIGGRDVTELPPNKRPTNMVFQRLALFPHLTVEANVAYGPRVKGYRGKKLADLVERMLQITSLTDFRGRYPGALSGGQQQRVAIARALANEPTVLLLDEPLSSLDLKLRTQMQVALKEIQVTSGTTFVYVTHDQNEALSMSDRMAVMNAGSIEQLGTPAELYASPRTHFVADFIGEMNFIDSAVLPVAWLAGPVVPGGRVGIRPEDLAISPFTPEFRSTGLRGVVTGQVFQGSHVRLLVSPDAFDGTLMANARVDDVVGLQPGDPVILDCKPSNVLLIEQ